jgi:hypothetical protein
VRGGVRSHATEDDEERVDAAVETAVDQRFQVFASIDVVFLVLSALLVGEQDLFFRH